MISPRLRNARMNSRTARTLLLLYAVRNLLGVFAFAWIIAFGFQVGGPIAWLFPILAVGYFGTAIYNGHKLYQQYRGILARERRESSGNATT
ncbi:MAG: hypothetical protein SFU56_17020 [Capsulimonadales bacterium]|nr:hypothetical protein [Capsulimonadales bacterium]